MRYRTWIRSVLLIAVGVVLGWGGSRLVVADRPTTSRVSPDETLRASLVEPAWSRIDRNFQVQIENLVTRKTTTIYRSPDEGRPGGTERLVWSKDGRWLLLVGRHFFVKEDLFLDNGDQLYLLHEVATGRSWVNAADSGDLPVLTAEKVAGIEFTEPVTLKER